MIGETILDRYTVVERLGDGGMGVVYRVQDDAGQPFAIKRLHAEVAADAKPLARFEREAAAHALLVHPNIATLYAVGATEDGGLCFVLEYVAGEDVGDTLERGPLPPSMAVTIARQALSGLHHAHQFGIVHRDLKPENILLAGWPEAPAVKLIDFGVVKPHTGDDFDTEVGTILGTPHYMAPEQARGQRDALDERTDVFGVGALLYEMLTGAPPYDQETEPLRLVHALRCEFVPPEQRRPELMLPGALTAIVHRAMAPDPKDRFPNIVALKEELLKQYRGFDFPERRVAKGDLVIREDEPGDEMYLVLAGRLEAKVGDRSVRVMGPGETFGELALLRDSPKRTASVIALEDSRLCVISRRLLEEELSATKPWMSTLLRTLAGRFEDQRVE